MKSLKAYGSAEAAQENLLNILDNEEVTNREVRYHILSGMVCIERALIAADKQAEEDSRHETPMERSTK